MATTLARKLKIKEDTTLHTINAPADFGESLGTLPPGVKLTSNGKKFDQVHWFVKNRKEMESTLSKILPLVKGDVICWIYYPKGSSGIQTDLTRDKGWDELLQHDMQWISLISFDDTWSAFGMREKSEADRKKEGKPKERAIFDYADPTTRTVRLPEDFAAALKKAKPAAAFFEKLSFTNKKEYIEWIISAKRDETRTTRVRESIERLGREWKNPSNR